MANCNVNVAPAAAVTVRGFAVDPSAHCVNTHRVSPEPWIASKLIEQLAPALHASVTGVVYVPGAQPAPVMVTGTGVVLAMVVSRLKFAVTALGASIVTPTGVAGPEAAPDQPLN
jgi:hypothetical protein